jgi:hypothetical protein
VEKKRCISNEEFAKQAIDAPAVADRVRLVALDNASALGSAKERSLRRELAIKTERLGKEDSRVKALSARLKQQQILRDQTKSEIERGQTVTPERREGVFVLHGRVVNLESLGQPGLTVSAIDSAGKAVVFECTDDRGYFKLEIGVEDSQKLSLVSLQVSEKSEKVLYRGDETYKVVSNGVVYREIVLGREKPMEPCPPPPKPEPQPDKIKVPNVVGLKLNSARKKLRGSGLTVGTIKKRVSEMFDVVLEQDPEAGREVTVSTPVNLVVGIAKEG